MVHSTVVCLPYDPLRCMPLNAICMSAVESIPHSTVLISVEGSTQPIYLYCLLYGPTSLQLFTALCGMDSTVACAWLVDSTSYEVFPLSYFLP